MISIDGSHKCKDATHMIICRVLGESPEAPHALELLLSRLGRRHLAGWPSVPIRSRSSSRVGLLRDNTFMLGVLDNVIRIVTKTLGFCECIDERFCLNGQKSFLQTFVEESIAGFADDEIGDLVKISSLEMLDQLLLGFGDHLAPKVANCTLCDQRVGVMDGSIELR